MHAETWAVLSELVSRDELCPWYHGRLAPPMRDEDGEDDNGDDREDGAEDDGKDDGRIDGKDDEDGVAVVMAPQHSDSKVVGKAR